VALVSTARRLFDEVPWVGVRFDEIGVAAALAAAAFCAATAAAATLIIFSIEGVFSSEGAGGLKRKEGNLVTNHFFSNSASY
jgi:hypothetical protein